LSKVFLLAFLFSEPLSWLKLKEKTNRSPDMHDTFARYRKSTINWNWVSEKRLGITEEFSILHKTKVDSLSQTFVFLALSQIRKFEGYWYFTFTFCQLCEKNSFSSFNSITIQ
jgi:hypothetical protein